MNRMEDSLFVKVLGMTPRLKVMDYLIDNMIFDVSLQDICDGTGFARNTVAKVLDSFLEQGVIKYTRTIGRAKMLTLNRENTLVKLIINMDSFSRSDMHS